MKSFIVLLTLIAIIFSQKFEPIEPIEEIDLDEGRGCIIKEKEGKCCWRNNNGCCKPPKIGQVCTQAFRTCCKTKVFDEETQTYKYTYS